MPTSTFVHPLFGAVTFRTANTTQWVRGDRISFVSGFDQGDIVPLRIPQLAAVPGSDGGTLPFHRRGHAQLLKAFADIEAAGLMPHIRTCAGTLNLRLRRPTSGGLSKLPSNHAFGIAIDLNSDDGSLGSSVAPVAPHFIANGFTWGADFADPMHFEVRRFSEPLDGLFQCSANSMALAPRLKALLVAAGGDGSCDSFIAQTKANHAFALEYCARLLRVTTKHHGTVRDGLIHPWLRRDAMGELMRCLELG